MSYLFRLETKLFYLTINQSVNQSIAQFEISHGSVECNGKLRLVIAVRDWETDCLCQ